MSNDNGSAGFLDRMVKLVSGSGRGSSDTSIPGGSDTTLDQFGEADKAELRAMIERKRRNDFVRKREFDMLRRIRREGLTGEQAYMLEAASSRLDDAETRPAPLVSNPGGNVKAKIDAIEKQMVGNVPLPAMAMRQPVRTAPPPAPRDARPTQSPTLAPPVRLAPTGGSSAAPPRPGFRPTQAPTRPGFSATQIPPVAAPARPLPPGLAAGMRPAAPSGAPAMTRPAGLSPATSAMPLNARPSAPAPLSAPVGAGRPPVPPPDVARRAPVLNNQPPSPPPPPPPSVLAPLATPAPMPVSARNVFSPAMAQQVEVSEVVHDHELDEAVIAFANADFSHCEQLLIQLTAHRGSRYKNPETWLVLFDLFRATGQQQRFDALTISYAELFQRSAPQWFSLPQLVIEASRNSTVALTRANTSEVGWVCPARLDLEALGQLSSQLLQMPSPWVLDWRLLMSIDTEAAAKLYSVFTQWANQTISMCWLNPERLLTVLQENTPAAMRDVDPAFWLARLAALRLANRPDQFDEVAIDYCVTYEVSPPSWEAAKGQIRIGDSQLHTQSAPLSVIGDVATTEANLADRGGMHAITTLDLSGQLSGDIGTVLSTLDTRLGESRFVHISCALLIRVDFIAAGDLLNWVIAKRSEGRHVSFIEVHRLVALMLGAMGITEHAAVRLRQA